MKVKLQSSDKLRLVKAVKDMLGLSLKETADLVNEQNPPKENNGSHVKRSVIIDPEMTKEQIEAIANACEVTYAFVDTCEAERKLQEVTVDDLGVSIHSIDEMSIGWQRKMLFTHEQATRVIASLLDAKINVTETHVMYEGHKTTMLVATKTFPSGAGKEDLEKFEDLIHAFICTVCEIIDLEERLESAKENAIKAFNELRDYEQAYIVLPESTTSQTKIEI